MRALAALSACVALSACASVDLVGAYRLSRQDYREIDPALWRAAAMRPDGVSVNAVTFAIRVEGVSEDAATIAFTESDEAPGAGLPKPGADEALVIFRIEDEALDEVRALQSQWSADGETDSDADFSASVSFSLTPDYERAYCRGEEKLEIPVWVRIDPEAGFRRILKPSAMDTIMRTVAVARCAEVLAEAP